MTEPPVPEPEDREDEERRAGTFLRTRIPLGRWIMRLWKGSDGGGEGLQTASTPRRTARATHRAGRLAAEASTQVMIGAGVVAVAVVSAVALTGEPSGSAARWAAANSDGGWVLMSEDITVRSIPVSGPVEASALGSDEIYDEAILTIPLDPGAIAWLALSSRDHLADDETGRPPGRDSTLDIASVAVDDTVVLRVLADGVSSGEIVLGDNDAGGSDFGNQAVLLGAYPSVTIVDWVDWDAEPPVYHLAAQRESGELSGFFAEHGATEYDFEFRFANRWSDSGGHDAVYLLIGEVRAGGSGPDVEPWAPEEHHHRDEHSPLGDPYDFF